MKNKRGLWFGEEIGKIVLAVLAIVLLVILMIKLIGIFIQKTEYEQAKVAMSEIERVVNSLKEGEVGYAFIESPKGWLLKKYSIPNRYGKIPQTCGGKECLCVCPGIDFSWLAKIGIDLRTNEKIALEIVSNCEKKGVCKNLEIPSVITSSCYIDLDECRIFDRVPLAFAIQKNKGGAVISSQESADATKIFSIIYSNETKFGILKNWSLNIGWGNYEKMKKMLKETIEEYKEAHNIEVERWYVLIGKIERSSGNVDYSEWGSDLTLGEKACIRDIRQKIIFKLLPILPGAAIADYSYRMFIEGREAQYESISKRCLGGEWFSMIFKIKEGNKEQDITIDIRVDLKKK